MTNRELSIFLSLKDQFSAHFRTIMDKIKDQASAMSKAFGGLGNIIAGAFSFFAVKGFVEESNKAELSIVRLRQALRNAGDGSAATTREMIAFSEAMMKVTTFDDDVITGLQGTLVAMTGLKGAAIQPLTKATLDLAVGLGIDADSAAMLIGKTIEGRDALGRYGISIKGAHTEAEKMGIIIAGVAEKFGGFAENEAKTAAGRMKQFAVSVDNVKEALGDLVKEVIVPLGPSVLLVIEGTKRVIVGSVSAIQTFFGTVFTGFIAIAAQAEKALNMLGLSSSHYFQDLLPRAIQTLKGYAQATVDAFGGKSQKDIKDTAITMNGLAGDTERLAFAVQAIKVTDIVFISSEQEKRFKAFEKLMDFFKQSKSLRQSLFEESLSDMPAILGGVKEVQTVMTEISDQDIWETYKREQPFVVSSIEFLANYLHSNFSQAWEGIFGEANSLLEQFMQHIAEKALSKGFGALLSLIPGVGGFLASLFHEGGVVPRAHGGMFIDAPSTREFPIMVRGGETVRTEGQEAALQRGGGMTVHINLNGPVTGDKQHIVRIVKDGVQEAMRQLGVTDVREFFVNNRNKISFAG